MYERVLIATDGTPGVDGAVEYGLTVAERFDAGVDALYVVDTDNDSLANSEATEALLESGETIGRRALAKISEHEPRLDVHQEIRRGTPYREILEHADERNVDLVVVGTSDSITEYLGSTAERVITFSSVPVLAVPGGGTGTPSLETIDDVVVPLDGSDAADRAAEHAIAFAELFGATVHGLYVVDTTVYDLEDAPRSIVGLLEEGGKNTLEAFTQQAESVQVPSTWRVTRGRPATEIFERIDAVGADLVAMGTRGRSGLPEHLLGSTTRRVVRDASCPVLSVS